MRLHRQEMVSAPPTVNPVSIVTAVLLTVARLIVHFMLRNL
jgi:hypothetical protein